VTGLNVIERELVVSTVTHAHPDLREVSARPTVWPLVSAIVTTALFIGTIFTQWAVVWFTLPLVAVVVAWFWPKQPADDA
jgi:cytochrome c oxidase subunit 1